MDRREELIQTIKDRVSVWDGKYEFADYIDVVLENGNRFEAYKLYIEQHDVYDDVMVSLYDEVTGACECYLQHLSTASLEKLSEELPLTYTIFVTAYKDIGERAFDVYSTPARANFSPADLENWLKENFPLLDWEPNDSASFICYTERIDHTGPYLLAELVYGEC